MSPSLGATKKAVMPVWTIVEVLLSAIWLHTLIISALFGTRRASNSCCTECSGGIFGRSSAPSVLSSLLTCLLYEQLCTSSLSLKLFRFTCRRPPVPPSKSRVEKQQTWRRGKRGDDTEDEASKQDQTNEKGQETSDPVDPSWLQDEES